MILEKLYKFTIIFFGPLIIGIYIFINDGTQYNFSVLILSYIISLIAFWKMTQSNGQPYSLNKMFFIFILTFIGIAPAVQFKHQVAFWGSIIFNEEDYFFLNLLFLAVIFIYIIFYTKFTKANKFSIVDLFVYNFDKRIINKNFKLRVKLLSISILSFLIFFYSINFNLFSLFIRGSFDNIIGNNLSDSDISGPISLIITIFIRPIPVISLILYKILNKKSDWFEVLLLFIVLVSNAPTGMSRFQAAALYIPLIILYFKFFQKGINFSMALLAGLLVLFPFLGLFRNFSPDVITLKNSNHFLKEDFDSYYNFLVLINEKTISYGKQLLGVLLFFIPRSYWEDKPIGSGAQLAKEADLFFSNIAMNYFAEGYINFGYIGIFIFTIVISYFNSTFDRTYWNSKDNSFIKLLFLILLGMEFFILRGDLMSSFAYTFGIALSVLFVFTFISKKNVVLPKPTNKRLNNVNSSSNKFSC